VWLWWNHADLSELLCLADDTAGDDWTFYGYAPSYTMAIVVCCLFGVVGFAHTFFMFKYRSFRQVSPQETSSDFRRAKSNCPACACARADSGCVLWGQQMWPFVLGCFGEAVGYAIRRLSAEHPKGRQLGLKYYIGQVSRDFLTPCVGRAPLCGQA